MYRWMYIWDFSRSLGAGRAARDKGTHGHGHADVFGQYGRSEHEENDEGREYLLGAGLRNAMQNRLQQEATTHNDEQQNCCGLEKSKRDIGTDREILRRKQRHQREERDYREVLE